MNFLRGGFVCRRASGTSNGWFKSSAGKEAVGS
jgi:hypothetical protein